MSDLQRDLLARLPHRPPFRFITSVLHLESGVRGDALWRVAGDEWFFSGHFPEQPIVPGVLIAEALAQLSGLVGLSPDRSHSLSEALDGRLASVDVRFDYTVRPPAEIQLSAVHTRTLGSLHQFEVSAKCSHQVAARGLITLAAAQRSPADAETLPAIARRHGGS